MKKCLLLLVLSVFLAFSASATTISEENVVVDLEEETVEISMEVEDLTTETFNFQARHRVENLEGWFEGEQAECSVENLPLGANVNCETDLEENFSVRLKYETADLVKRSNGFWNFSYSQSIYRPVRNYSFMVALPEGTVLLNEDYTEGESFYPRDGMPSTSLGRRFFVEWERQPQIRSEPLRFQVLYENPERNPLRDLIPVLAGLGLIIILAALVYRRRGKIRGKSVLEELGSDEEMVLDILKDQEGEMLQKDIVEESDYSKAKISGVVGQLEERGIVEKEKEGRSNKVRVKDKFRD